MAKQLQELDLWHHLGLYLCLASFVSFWFPHSKFWMYPICILAFSFLRFSFSYLFFSLLLLFHVKLLFCYMLWYFTVQDIQGRHQDGVWEWSSNLLSWTFWRRADCDDWTFFKINPFCHECVRSRCCILLIYVCGFGQEGFSAVYLHLKKNRLRSTNNFFLL